MSGVSVVTLGADASIRSTARYVREPRPPRMYGDGPSVIELVAGPGGSTQPARARLSDPTKAQRRIVFFMPQLAALWVIPNGTQAEWSATAPRRNWAHADFLRIERDVRRSNINRLLKLHHNAVVGDNRRLPHRLGIHGRRHCNKAIGEHANASAVNAPAPAAVQVDIGIDAPMTMGGIASSPSVAPSSPGGFVARPPSDEVDIQIDHRCAVGNGPPDRPSAGCLPPTRQPHVG